MAPAASKAACALSLALALAPGAAALHSGGAGAHVALRSAPGSTLRLAGGEPDDALKEARRRRLDGAAAEEDGGDNDLKAAARRRAEAARNAGSHPRDSIGKTAYRVFFSATNKLGLTGSSTRIVNGQVVVRRNLVQKLFHLIYVFFRAIYYFFKTLVVPLSTLEPQKRGSGGGRGSFSQMRKSNVVKMADLPPMPGG